jgi:lipopolysaccharide/colanic/teichoic acid biosynthesis glycosyltransferase
MNSTSDLGTSHAEGYPVPRPIPAWKRPLDLILVFLVLPIAAPLLLLAAAWVSLVSAGNVLFLQERVGRGGRRFACYKLRTMRVNCGSAEHERHLQQLLRADKPMLKLDTRDPRLIPGARILRALGIDELPQLLNVIRGEMSIVGPRPCIPYEADQYQPWQRERFAGLPGMTGLWQVRGKNRTTFLEMIHLDIEYVRSQSLWMDTRILLATPKALVVQLGYAIKNRTNSARRRSSAGRTVPIPSTDSSGAVG